MDNNVNTLNAKASPLPIIAAILLLLIAAQAFLVTYNYISILFGGLIQVLASRNWHMHNQIISTFLTTPAAIFFAIVLVMRRRNNLLLIACCMFVLVPIIASAFVTFLSIAQHQVSFRFTLFNTLHTLAALAAIFIIIMLCMRRQSNLPLIAFGIVVITSVILNIRGFLMSIRVGMSVAVMFLNSVQNFFFLIAGFLLFLFLYCSVLKPNAKFSKNIKMIWFLPGVLMALSFLASFFNMFFVILSGANFGIRLQALFSNFLFGIRLEAFGLVWIAFFFVCARWISSPPDVRDGGMSNMPHAQQHMQQPQYTQQPYNTQ